MNILIANEEKMIHKNETTLLVHNNQ